jgi:serine/threonine-protein kinase
MDVLPLQPFEPEFLSGDTPGASTPPFGAIPISEIQDQLERILGSTGFRSSLRLQRFLRLAVERTLAGETDQLKEYAVGRDAFDRGADYDPRLDSIVRVEARRLRKKLREYYRTAGAAEPVMIEFPHGSYVPKFTRTSSPGGQPAPPSRPAPSGPGKGPESPAVVPSFSDTPPDPCTIAVLPFSNLSPEPEQQYFCDGMTEDIINALTAIAELQVIGRTSTFALEPGVRDLREIGARLGAGTIVEGSVRKAGEMLRVSAKIIDSETRQTKWSQVFDRQTQDVFAIEDEIAHSIAGVLRISLQPVEPRDPSRKAPSTEAYALYLKGRQAWNQMTRPGFLAAIDLFNRAILLYPDYAPPYSGLAYAYMWLSMWGMIHPAEAFRKSKEAAQQALLLDPGWAAAYATLGTSVFFYEGDHQQGLTLLKRAIELQPSYAVAHQIYGIFLTILGRFEEALAPLKRAVHLDPLSLRTNRTLGLTYYLMGRLQDAEHWIEAAIAVRPDAAESHYLLARVYLQQGELDRALSAARECDRGDATGAIPLSILGVVLARRGDAAGALGILRRLEEMSSAGYVDPMTIASIETALGNYSAALAHVRTAQEQRSPQAAFVDIDPLFEALRSSPEFCG